MYLNKLILSSQAGCTCWVSSRRLPWQHLQGSGREAAFHSSEELWGFQSWDTGAETSFQYHLVHFVISKQPGCVDLLD